MKTRRSRKAKGTRAAPRAFAEWRPKPADRDEDAAYAFGYHLVLHCRDEALKNASVEEAVDAALHNVLDMLEGFWRLGKVDLPIGYWKWARNREFR